MLVISLFQLKTKSPETSDVIVSTKSMFFFNFECEGVGGGRGLLPEQPPSWVRALFVLSDVLTGSLFFSPGFNSFMFQ